MYFSFLVPNLMLLFHILQDNSCCAFKATDLCSASLTPPSLSPSNSLLLQDKRKVKQKHAGDVLLMICARMIEFNVNIESESLNSAQISDVKEK